MMVHLLNFVYRPVTTASGRHVRLGTASMLTEPGGPFIDVSKLNLAKYANRPALAKVRELAIIILLILLIQVTMMTINIIIQ